MSMTTDGRGNLICQIFQYFNIISFHFAVCPPYLFLWQRQRYMFSHPSLQPLKTKLINFLSYACLVVIVFGGVGNCVLYVMSLNVETTPLGCGNRAKEKLLAFELHHYFVTTILAGSHKFYFLDYFFIL